MSERNRLERGHPNAFQPYRSAISGQLVPHGVKGTGYFKAKRKLSQAFKEFHLVVARNINFNAFQNVRQIIKAQYTNFCNSLQPVTT